MSSRLFKIFALRRSAVKPADEAAARMYARVQRMLAAHATADAEPQPVPEKAS